ncbi:IS3 family transposase [Flavisolibacter ginsenosidimutans]|uniref:IS3 family transposase n=1 Tax=Flavisolibacter ginsenosidimutans TaxID=661481 RepID=UPI0021CDF5D9|nr:IS3 family transposase [Flavisolibacter ginsenosidimutans]
MFGKTRQAFYEGGWRKEKQSMEAALVLKQVALIRRELPKVGTRKLQYLLKDFFVQHHIKMGRDALFSLLMEEGLLVKKRKRKVSTTNSRHRFRKYPNLVRELELVRSEQVWVSDITYIALPKSFCYLSLITDAYSKKIVGYNLEDTLETEGCLKALAMALSTRSKTSKQGLIHHSDRGIQYCSTAYVQLLLASHVAISMTEKSDPYENAVAERINGILKEEFNLSRTFQNIHQANSVVGESITLYNSKRPHSSIGYLTPDKAHTENVGLTKHWKTYRKNAINGNKEG